MDKIDRLELQTTFTKRRLSLGYATLFKALYLDLAHTASALNKNACEGQLQNVDGLANNEIIGQEALKLN